MSDIIISGYYGLGNSGDEALLKSIVSDLKNTQPQISITALSGNTSLTRKLYGIKTVNRFNLFSVVREMRNAKLLISGGGTLIQDATSTKSLLYYLAIIFLAKKMGLKVMLYANGMGPIKEKNIKKVNKVLNMVDLITLRENVSLEEIERCDIKKPRVLVTADPAFNLESAPRECADKIFADYSIGKNERLVAVSVRECANMPEDFAKQMAVTLDEISKMGYLPVFIPMQKSRDLALSLEIAGKMKEQSRVIDCDLSIPDMLAIIGRCSVVCGMRLHMLIFASVMNVPMAGIAYDPKIRGFMEYMNQKTYVELDKFDSEQFLKMAVYCTENADKMKEKLKEESLPLRKKAMDNALLAIELLNS